MFLFPNIYSEVLALAVLLMLIALIVTLVFTIRNTIKLKKVLKNCSSGKLDETIELYYNKVSELSGEIDKRAAQFDKIEKMICAGVQKFSAVRYNAFDNISNNLSFSLALLDSDNTGYIITSIYGRDGSNLYIKPVFKGKSNSVMSDEEVQAYEDAVTNYENKLK